MQEAVAIIGMASLFPGAPDLSTFWANIRSGFDAISEVPAARWDPVFYDPAAASSRTDRLYCRRGGFVDALARFDPIAHGVMPVAVRGAEPDQLLALELAERALVDAGWADRPFAREKAGVIIGRGNYASAARTRLEQHVRGAQQLVQALRSLVPGLDDRQLTEVRSEFQAALAQPGPDAAIGLVPNLTASRIANRLDLGGPAFTVDAACASSLVAVDQGCVELASGRCDLVIAGGVHLCQDEVFWSVFCQLGALSRSQQIRPFDRRADGLLIGEGLGLLVLKRLFDAERDDDRIYAVIRGTGTSSDGRASSLMNPRVEGQLLALERAWKSAGLDPKSVELVEAHGTGTPAGDAAEIETLRRFFGQADADRPRAVLGSIKSMIGHAMPAAGVAGLIKAALALHHAELPPTLHCEEPHPALAATRFRTLARSEPWDRGTARSGLPRFAAVNAFGFGGINAHVVLEEARLALARRRVVLQEPRQLLGPRSAGVSIAEPLSPDERICCLAAATSSELVSRIESQRARASPHAAGRAIAREGAGPCRLAVLNPTADRLARARAIVEGAQPWNGREGIWFAPRALLADGGLLAYVFPGIDASFRPRVEDVAAHFGQAVPYPLKPVGIEENGLAIIRTNTLFNRVLTECGVRPDAMLGHSIGEWSAMIAAGMIPDSEVDSLIAGLKGSSLEVPGVIFAAAGCSAERAAAAVEGLPSIALSHDNCPHQVILCGVEASVDAAMERLLGSGVLCQRLPFRSGFHSPLFEPFLAPHRERFQRLVLKTPRVPVFSATTCAPFPPDPEAIRSQAVRHLIEPVRFRELIHAVWTRGTRVFVQVGTGSLPGFIEDTLRGLPHLAISANVPTRTGLDQLRQLMAALFVNGAEPALERLLPGGGLPPDRNEPEQRPAAATNANAVQLSLGVPLVHLKKPLAVSRPTSAPTHPLAAAFHDVMGEVERAQAEILNCFEVDRPAPPGPREARTVRSLSVDSMPELIDHTFFRQPPGWPVLSDRHPVVPMTASIQLMVEAAASLVPEKMVVGVDDVRAFRWLVAARPLALEIVARYDGDERVEVSIEGYSTATVRVAPAYPAAPEAPPALTAADGARPATVTPAQLYADRWMFHGPRYQGIVELGPVADRAIAGVLEARPAKGALLDNAGQLFGFLVMVENSIDRMAMPVKIDRLRFFGPHPDAGLRLPCLVRIKSQGEKDVVADLWLTDPRTGRCWATIEGWEDRRFETDDRLWPVMVYPEKNLLAVPRPEGWVLFTDRYRGATTRDNLHRRFLGERERAVYEAQTPRKQREWLNGRIAAKDAVRDLLWRQGHGPLFPVEVEITNDERGRPLVNMLTRRDLDLRVSLAHKGELAVAIAAEGRNVGIDLEVIEPRPAHFVELAFNRDELALKGPSEEGDEWIARLWTAKEAVGKSRGTGLSGDPRRLRATEREGERIRVDGSWVLTRREGNHIISWTLP